VDFQNLLLEKGQAVWSVLHLEADSVNAGTGESRDAV
jgi:hypothetical protein